MTSEHTGHIRTIGPTGSRLVVALAALVATLLVAAPVPARAAVGDPAWGVLASTCDPDRLSRSRAAGLTIVEIDAAWDRYLPARAGVVDGAYVADLRARISRCAAAGFRVVLGSGTQYPPAWVKALPGAAYRDQRGASPATPAIDVVFSSAVRAAQADYLRRLVTELPSSTVEAVRIGTSDAGEIGYPGPDEANDGFLQSWWAFGAAPQQGTGLAAGMTRSPMPGWVPGQRTWNGRALTATDARGWFTWYERSLVGSWTFQADTLRAAGFAGDVHLPAPGKGVLPADLNRAAAGLLGGAGDRDGSLGRGLYYVDQMPLAATSIGGNLVVDLTGVDDASSVAARGLTPPQDVCTLDDAGLSVNPATRVETWSNLRFARAQAARANLPAIGENPGPPGPTTGGVAGADSEAEQVRRAPALARSCRLAALLFAFEDDLFTNRSGISLADYRAAIGG